MSAPRHRVLSVALAAALSTLLHGCDGARSTGQAAGAQAMAQVYERLPEHPTTGSPVLRRSTDKSFQDVIFELEFAITERNYRITGRNTLGKALRARGYSGYPDAEVIHFCSVERARIVLDLDPDYLAQMPCRITVHVEDNRTVVHGILLPTNHPDARVVEFARETNALIQDILDFAVPLTAAD